MVRTTSHKQISRTFQGFFKDKLQFLRTKIYSEFKNQRSLIPFWTPHEWLKQAMESFATFSSSATVDHIIFYFPPTTLCKMTCNCILGTKRIWNKETEVKYCSCTKMFLRYPWVLQVLTPRMSQIFLSEKKLILQKIVSGVDKVVNFKDFSRPYKEIKYFSRRLLKFKTFSRLSELR